MDRIFIAIDISGEAKQFVLEYSSTLRGQWPELRIGWEPAEKLHITLRFLGDADQAKVADIIRAATDAVAYIPEFHVAITGTGVFPGKRRPRVLWLGVEDKTGILEEIKSNLDHAFEKIDYSREGRPFRPHLTIARLRQPEQSRKLAEFHLNSDVGPIGFVVSNVSVYSSRLEPAGSIHTIVKSFRLG